MPRTHNPLGEDRNKNICHYEKENSRKSHTLKHDTEIHIYKKTYLYICSETKHLIILSIWISHNETYIKASNVTDTLFFLQEAV